MELFDKEIDYDEQNKEERIRYDLDDMDENVFFNKTIEQIKTEYFVEHSYKDLPIIKFDSPYLKEEPDIGRESTRFNIYIPLDGDMSSLNYRPTSQYLRCHRYYAVIDKNENAICLPVSIRNTDSFDIDNLIENTINDRRKNIEIQYHFLESDITKYNSKLKNFIEREVNKLYDKIKLKIELKEKSRKSKYLKIVPKETSPIKIVEKKIETNKEVNIVETSIKKEKITVLEEKSYLQIIDTLNELSIYAQRLPKSYIKLDEEDIRDQIVNALNLKLKTATATGETFNVKGKTDIIIIDNKIIYFIAECKIWKGSSLFNEAIEQLLSYVSEDIFYTSLIIFNKNKGEIIDSVIKVLKGHHNYLNQISQNRFKFKHPRNEKYQLEVSMIIFNLV